MQALVPCDACSARSFFLTRDPRVSVHGNRADAVSPGVTAKRVPIFPNDVRLARDACAMPQHRGYFRYVDVWHANFCLTRVRLACGTWGCRGGVIGASLALLAGSRGSRGQIQHEEAWAMGNRDKRGREVRKPKKGKQVPGKSPYQRGPARPPAASPPPVPAPETVPQS